MSFKKILILLIIFSVFYFVGKTPAQDNSQVSELQKKIQEYQTRLSELSQQRNTLSSQIQYMDIQIYLANLKIQDTEQKISSTTKEIGVLETRIDGLDESLDYISHLFLDKIVQSYKQRQISLFSLLFDSQNADDLLNKIKYIKTTRNNNQRLIVQVQQTKSNFEEQKKLREEKKTELDNLRITLDQQKVDLDNQKTAKQRLLTETQNSEKVYQNLLSRAQAEYAAIQGIIAGAGTETQIREIKKGDLIATVISGRSCNSTGSHLHFIVKEGEGVQNPFDFLGSISYKSFTSDPWTQNGSRANFDWPMSGPIEFHQGYGITDFVKTYGWYPFHNGIDIFGSSYNIYAVADGILYRGSYAIGCTLPYTKLVHKDSNITTLYLHTYTQ